MVLAVGVIGTGNIGTDHVRRIASETGGARVAAVFDVDVARATAVAQPHDAAVHRSAEAVITDPAVGAVVIASPGDTHADLVLACIAADKPVLCEKPLATTSESARKAMEAEVAHGRRLVQVGFMRRYDAAYREVKAALDGGVIGDALMVHCVHRNADVPPFFTGDMSLTDSVVHEVDSVRWLLGREITAATVLAPPHSPLAAENLRDPLFVLLETAGGALVDVEIFVTAQYGYDVRCEVVGASGTAALETPSVVTVTGAGGRGRAVPSDWKLRFAAAYRDEVQAWIDSVAAGVPEGPSAWDGYAGSAVTEACVESLAAGARVPVQLVERPALYT